MAAKMNRSVATTDFWSNHDPAADPIVAALVEEGYSISHDVRRADVVVASVFGRRHWSARRHVAMFSGEAFFRDDFARFTIDCRFREQANHLRLPLWAYLLMKRDLEDLVLPAAEPGERFCNFIYSNPRGLTRTAFFETLHRTKPVDSLGSVMRNRSDARLEGRHGQNWRTSKQQVLQDYRFTIAFENSELPGYTTEKVIDAWLAGSVPIYWGNPEILADFPQGSCLNAYEAGSLDRLVEQVLEAEHEPERYAQLQAANPFRTGAALVTLRTFSDDLRAFARSMAEEERRNPKGRVRGTPARLAARTKWATGKVLRAVNGRRRG